MNEVRWRAEGLLYLYLGMWVAEEKGTLLPQRYTQFTQGQYVCPQELTLSFLVVFVQPPSHVWLFVTPWTEAQQASLSLTTSQSLPKFMSIALVMPPGHLIFRCPLLLLPSVFPRIRDFSNEPILCISWPKYWSFIFSISPSNEYSGLVSLKIDWFDLTAVQGTCRFFSGTTVWRHQFFGTPTSLPSSSHNCMWPLGRL